MPIDNTFGSAIRMLKNAAVYMTGSVFAQGLMLAAVPILSRLYSPRDFGAFGMFTALLSIFGVAACLRYELAIPLPKSDRRAASVFAVGLLNLLCASLLVFAGVCLGRHQVAEWLGTPSLSTLLWLLPLSVLGYGLYELLNYWSTRSGRFFSLSASHVLRAGSVTGTQIGGASMAGSGIGLVLGQLIGQWVANALLLRQTLRRDYRLFSGSFSVKRARAQARRYRTFAVHASLQAVLNAASQAIPTIMLGWFFSPAIVGLYVMAQRVVSAPMSLISQSLRQAMLPHFSRQLHLHNPLAPLLWRYTSGLAAVGLPVVGALVFYGPELFGLVLGEHWKEAGYYARWVVLWLWAGMMNPPSIVLLTVLEKQKLQAVYELMLFIARALALISAAWTKSEIITIAAFSITGFLFNISLIWIAYTQSKTMELGKGVG